MILWRISNYATLDGRGGLFASARWHTRGRPIVYLTETPAGAMTEVLVHLELEPGNLPASYKLLKAEAPDDLAFGTITQSELPEGWKDDVAVTRTIGDQWLAANTTALLRVPSVIVPETCNFLLNPHHVDAPRLAIVSYTEYPWDQRLF